MSALQPQTSTTHQPIYTKDSGVSFNEHLADMIGMRAAVVYENIKFWTQKNTDKGINRKEGRSWTYQGVREMAERIKGLSEKEVRNAIGRLREYGLILARFFGGCDRRTWYTLASEVNETPAEVKPAQKQVKQSETPAVVHLPKRANGFSETGECLHIHTQIQKKLVSKPAPLSRDELLNLFSDGIQSRFDIATLEQHADDYLTFCERVQGTATPEGFRNKMVSKIEQANYRELNRQAIEDLAEAKRDKLAALTVLNLNTASDIESVNINKFSGAAA